MRVPDGAVSTILEVVGLIGLAVCAFAVSPLAGAAAVCALAVLAGVVLGRSTRL